MFQSSGDVGGTHPRIKRSLYLIGRSGVSFSAVSSSVEEVSRVVPVHTNGVDTFVDVVVVVVATVVGMVAVVVVGMVTSKLVVAAAVAVVDTGVAAVVVG